MSKIGNKPTFDVVEMLRTPTGCEPPSRWELLGAKEIERLRTALRRIRSLEAKNVPRYAQLIAIQALDD